MTSLDVFPRHNLDPEAVPWARGVEESIRSASYRNSNADLGIKGSNRATAGQMGALGRQVDDLRSRTTQTLSIPRATRSLTLPANYGVADTTFSTTVRLAPPFDGKLRSIVLFLSAIAYNSDSNSNGTVYVQVNGVASKPMAAPAFTSVPPGYVETLSLSTVVDTGPLITLNLFLLGSNNTANSRTITLGLENIEITAVYGDVI